jgi:catechol-2,3-dioxygenase
MKFTGNRDIAVTVESLKKSRVFYENVLGLTPKKVGEKLTVYDTGSITLYV